jgi:hypothetical protein
VVNRPKLTKNLRKVPPRSAFEALLGTIALDHGSKLQIDWAEGDLAPILAALLDGRRADGIR